MTITIFDSIIGHYLRERPGLERIMNNISDELEVRRARQRTRKELVGSQRRAAKGYWNLKAQALKEANRGFWD